jgi:hypothetical protein
MFIEDAETKAMDYSAAAAALASWPFQVVQLRVPFCFVGLNEV